eukprot:1752944-Pleurochrysis_carterae.AAC.7
MEDVNTLTERPEVEERYWQEMRCGYGAAENDTSANSGGKDENESFSKRQSTLGEECRGGRLEHHDTEQPRPRYGTGRRGVWTNGRSKCSE